MYYLVCRLMLSKGHSHSLDENMDFCVQDYYIAFYKGTIFFMNYHHPKFYLGNFHCFFRTLILLKQCHFDWTANFEEESFSLKRFTMWYILVTVVSMLNANLKFGDILTTKNDSKISSSKFTIITITLLRCICYLINTTLLYTVVPEFVLSMRLIVGTDKLIALWLMLLP